MKNAPKSIKPFKIKLINNKFKEYMRYKSISFFTLMNTYKW